MPSLHIAWTLLGAGFIRPRIRWIALPFLLLMMTAVIGTGEHYLIDVVLAVPYTFAVLCVEESVAKWIAVARPGLTGEVIPVAGCHD